VSSYLAFPSLPAKAGGIFLLHFPGSHLRLTLSAILPYEARTFLTVIPFGVIPRDRLAELPLYYIIFLKFVKGGKGISKKSPEAEAWGDKLVFVCLGNH